MTALADQLPTLAAVLPVDAGGEKRTRVLRALATFADQGSDVVLVRELADRAKVDQARLWHLVERLQADGLVAVEWSGTGRTLKRFEVLPDRAGA